MKKYLILFALIIIQGCSSGGGDSTAAPTTTNPSGYPDVAGTYAFTTGDVNFICSDGSTGVLPPISQNMVVTQTDNVITLTNPPGTPSDIPGITLISETPNTGTVTTSGSFTTSRIITVYFDQLFTNATVNYSVTGTFTSIGWSGNYRYIVSFTDIGGSCDYTTTFSGSKINTTPTLLLPINIDNGNYSYESEFYLDLSKVGSFL